MQYTVLLGDDKTDPYVITVEMKKVVNPLVLDQTPFFASDTRGFIDFLFLSKSNDLGSSRACTYCASPATSSCLILNSLLFLLDYS
jgi:hypothetical protein